MPGEPEHGGREAEQEHADAERGHGGGDEGDEHADDGEHRRADHGVAFADAGDEPSGRQVADEFADHEHGRDEARERERGAASVATTGMTGIIAPSPMEKSRVGR